MREVDALCDSWMGSNDKVESYCGYLLLNSTILHKINIGYIVTVSQKDRHSVSVNLAGFL